MPTNQLLLSSDQDAQDRQGCGFGKLSPEPANPVEDPSDVSQELLLDSATISLKAGAQRPVDAMGSVMHSDGRKAMREATASVKGRRGRYATSRLRHRDSTPKQASRIQPLQKVSMRQRENLLYQHIKYHYHLTALLYRKVDYPKCHSPLSSP